jgi:hypothetical protein
LSTASNATHAIDIRLSVHDQVFMVNWNIIALDREVSIAADIAEFPDTPGPDQLAEALTGNLEKVAMGGDRVGVFFAAEVNRVLDVPDRGKKRVIDQVIPRTNVDMVSYSSYDALRDTQANTESELRRAFQFIYSKLADSYGLGTKRPKAK